MWEIFTYGAWGMLIIMVAGTISAIVYHRSQTKKIIEDDTQLSQALTEVGSLSKTITIGDAGFEEDLLTKDVFRQEDKSDKFYGGGDMVIQFKMHPKIYKTEEKVRKDFIWLEKQIQSISTSDDEAKKKEVLEYIRRMDVDKHRTRIYTRRAMKEIREALLNLVVKPNK